MCVTFQNAFEMSFQMHFVIVNSLNDFIRKAQYLFKIHFKLFFFLSIWSVNGEEYFLTPLLTYKYFDPVFHFASHSFKNIKQLLSPF